MLQYNATKPEKIGLSRLKGYREQFGLTKGSIVDISIAYVCCRTEEFRLQRFELKFIIIRGYPSDIQAQVHSE